MGFNLDCSRWLHRQLKNCSFLTFSHTVQERDLAVWKFQRIMMSRDLFLVDLPKDRRLSVYHTRWESPRPRGAGRVVSSRGEQGAVRPARAAGAAGSPILFFVRAMAGAAGRGGGHRRHRR